MKRSIIIFILAFLITLGIGGGLFYYMKEQEAAKAMEQKAAAIAAQETEARRKAAEAKQEEERKAEEARQAAAAAEKAASDAAAEQAAAAEKAAQEKAAQEKAAQESQEAAKETAADKPQPRHAAHALALNTAEALKNAETRGEALQKLVESGKLTPEDAETLRRWAEQHPVGDVEEVGNFRDEDGNKVLRYRLKSADGQSDILLDVRSDAQGNTSIVKVQESSADKTSVNASSDSLSVAEGFVESVKRGDMLRARKLVKGNGVSDATVAGLCMIFEEGIYKLREDAPIRNTFENPEHSGYLVYLVTPENPKPGNIGLEMDKDAEGWHISAVALDALLSAYESSANAEGGHYFPIVKNPKGGDSLALFFAFNQYELTPRSMRQLQIVAELLKQSQGKLNISGHTDDVGSESYNQGLSERRANAVKDALISFGVQAEQISTEGMGKSQPRRTYKSEDSEQTIDYIRGENRRAEIYLDFE